MPGLLGRLHQSLDEDLMVVVGRPGIIAFLWGASCGDGCLNHVSVTGASDNLLFLPSVRVLGVLLYLVLFSCSL